MNYTLELVCVPVRDVDRAKAFYAEQLGFVVDHDTTVSADARIVQLTPPGSGCSICIGNDVVDMEPGSLKGLQLVVNDVVAARAELASRGVAVSAVQVYGRDGLRPYEEGEELNNVGVCSFDDADGNGWVIQQITARA